MYEIVYKWGVFEDHTRWFIKLEALDTDMYAVAYFSLDDTNPTRFLETNDMELLNVLLEALSKDLYFDCVDKKNMYLESQTVSFEDATVANFM